MTTGPAMTNAVTLVIGRSWDGALLPEAERSTVRIGFEGERLRIEVDAPFAGDPAPPGAPGPTERLWEHEVVELFVVGEAAAEGDPVPYTEIELSPHGHHLVLRLVGVRNIVEQCLPADFATSVGPQRWRGSASLERSLLPARPVRCNAFRVAGRGADRRFEAMVAVPGDRPDFHRLERFAPWPL
jgi:hypothetical protein